MATLDPGGLEILLLVGCGVLGVFVAGASAIGVTLGAEARIDDAGFIAPPGPEPRTRLRGTGARTTFRRSLILSAVLPFAPLLVAAVAISLTGATWLAMLGAELALPAAIALTGRTYQRFCVRLEAEARAGYSSFERSPFGEPVRGLWTGVGSPRQHPPIPMVHAPTPPLDPAIADALDDGLELSPPLVGVTVPPAPPALLPGVSAQGWFSRGWPLMLAGQLGWVLVFLPTTLAPIGDVRTGLMSIAVVVFIGCLVAGTACGHAGNRRAYAERAAGYTTLRGRDDAIIAPRGPIVDAWTAFSTDRLWHLDPRTGAVIRPPLDPIAALRDPRVHQPMRRLFGPVPPRY